MSVLRVQKQSHFGAAVAMFLNFSFYFNSKDEERERQRTINQESKNPVTESFFKLASRFSSVVRVPDS